MEIIGTHPAKASTAPNLCPQDELGIQSKCMQYIYDLINSDTKLVLDADYEISAFQKYGIRIYFLDEEYARTVYQKKILKI